jgi:SpoVK/Ycf46/Vps4 family AAA+-type ATPase
VASQLDCNFLKVVSSAIVDKYIGESARMIREMFAYAKDHQPCIIFMDEIDAIGELLHNFSVFRFILNFIRSGQVEDDSQKEHPLIEKFNVL